MRFKFQPLILTLLLVSIAGCSPPIASYTLNNLYMRKQENESADFTDEQIDNVAEILTAMFGTPDEPTLPGGVDGLTEVIDPSYLSMAAGPVRVDEYQVGVGLYRRHCVHCHGTSGDGHGPTAPYLNPYPRDYRSGVFKFKSTPIGARPTHEDLKRVLVNGVAGTSMPSFVLSKEVEIESLVYYVKYLSIRGEVERRLYEEMAQELDEGELLVPEGEDMQESIDYLLDEIVGGVVAKWRAADSQMTPVPQRPEMTADEMEASVKRGQELFYGAVANCVKCHGDSQLGDGQMDDYDSWGKDFVDLTAVTNPEEKQEYIDEIEALGGLKPRHIIPRNLRSGVYRGGRRPVDLYWRVHNGIDGGPMPAASLKPEGAGPEAKGLDDSDIWDLVNYVLSLPYEKMHTQGADEPVYTRARQ
ncbi:MAG: cytochrome c [Planctomycetota bacterium]